MGEKKLKQADRAMWVSMFIIFPVILAIVLKILFEKKQAVTVFSF